MASHTHSPYDIPPDEPDNDTFASEEVTASDTTTEHRPNAFTGNYEIEREVRGSSEFESSSEEFDYKNGFFTEKAHDGLQSTPTNAPDFKTLFEDLSQRFVEEARKSDNKYEASKLHCENMIGEKENLLLSQKKTIDSYHVKMNEANELKLIYDNLKHDYDKITSAHLVEQKICFV